MVSTVEARPLNYFLMSQEQWNELKPDDQCSSCLASLKDGTPVVYHEEEGILHPIHKDCMRDWTIYKLTCPSCRKSIQFDDSALYTLSERVKFVAQRVIKGSTPIIKDVLLEMAAARCVTVIAETTGLPPLYIGSCLHFGTATNAIIRAIQLRISNGEVLAEWLCLPAALATLINPNPGGLIAAGTGYAINMLTQKSAFPGMLFASGISSLYSEEIGSNPLVAGALSFSFALLDLNN